MSAVVALCTRQPLMLPCNHSRPCIQPTVPSYLPPRYRSNEQSPVLLGPRRTSLALDLSKLPGHEAPNGGGGGQGGGHPFPAPETPHAWGIRVSQTPRLGSARVRTSIAMRLRQSKQHQQLRQSLAVPSSPIIGSVVPTPRAAHLPHAEGMGPSFAAISAALSSAVPVPAPGPAPGPAVGLAPPAGRPRMGSRIPSLLDAGAFQAGGFLTPAPGSQRATGSAQPSRQGSAQASRQGSEAGCATSGGGATAATTAPQGRSCSQQRRRPSEATPGHAEGWRDGAGQLQEAQAGGAQSGLKPLGSQIKHHTPGQWQHGILPPYTVPPQVPQHHQQQQQQQKQQQQKQQQASASSIVQPRDEPSHAPVSTSKVPLPLPVAAQAATVAVPTTTAAVEQSMPAAAPMAAATQVAAASSPQLHQKHGADTQAQAQPDRQVQPERQPQQHGQEQPDGQAAAELRVSCSLESLAGLAAASAQSAVSEAIRNISSFMAKGKGVGASAEAEVVRAEEAREAGVQKEAEVGGNAGEQEEEQEEAVGDAEEHASVSGRSGAGASAVAEAMDPEAAGVDSVARSVSMAPAASLDTWAQEDAGEEVTSRVAAAAGREQGLAGQTACSQARNGQGGVAETKQYEQYESGSRRGAVPVPGQHGREVDGLRVSLAPPGLRTEGSGDSGYGAAQLQVQGSAGSSSSSVSRGVIRTSAGSNPTAAVTAAVRQGAGQGAGGAAASADPVTPPPPGARLLLRAMQAQASQGEAEAASSDGGAEAASGVGGHGMAPWEAQQQAPGQGAAGLSSAVASGVQAAVVLAQAPASTPAGGSSSERRPDQTPPPQQERGELSSQSAADVTPVQNCSPEAARIASHPLDFTSWEESSEASGGEEDDREEGLRGEEAVHGAREEEQQRTPEVETQEEQVGVVTPCGPSGPGIGSGAGAGGIAAAVQQPASWLPAPLVTPLREINARPGATVVGPLQRGILMRNAPQAAGEWAPFGVRGRTA